MSEETGSGQEIEERRVQREVLAFVLIEHPARVTVRDLRVRLGRSAQVERAVDALMRDELLVHRGAELVPTPAAIRFSKLEPIEPPENA